MLQLPDSTWGGGEGSIQSSRTFRPIATPSTDLDTIESIQSSLVVPHFTSDDAFTLGLLLRQRIAPNPKPCVVTILSANNHQLLFHCTTRPGTNPDNDIWVQRKTRTVLRFGVSSYYMGVKFESDEPAFAAKYGLSPEDAVKYAIHGGAVPIRVKGVEGIVAVVVVSGLKQHEDHGVVVEVMQEWIETL